MTAVRIYRENGSIAGIDVQGHSGYADHGADIVCAAVTSAVRLIESAINDVLRLDVPFFADGKGVRVRMKIPERCREDERVRVILEAFAVHMAQLSREYEENIQVLEVSSC